MWVQTQINEFSLGPVNEKGLAKVGNLEDISIEGEDRRASGEN